MKSIIKRLKQYLFGNLGNCTPNKISTQGWGNSYNDIYILRLILRSYRHEN